MRIRAEQKEQIRTALLHAGIELIEKHGIEATTIEAITSRAGVAKGTFYNYFKTKHDLVYAAVLESSQGWEPEFDLILTKHPTTLERLREVFQRIIAWVEQHPDLNWIWLMERLQRIRSSEDDRSHFTEIIKRVFAAGQAAGEIRTDRPPEDFAHDLSGLFLVHAARAYHLGKPDMLYRTLPSAVEVYVNGSVAITTMPYKGDEQKDERA